VAANSHAKNTRLLLKCAAAAGVELHVDITA